MASPFESIVRMILSAVMWLAAAVWAVVSPFQECAIRAGLILFGAYVVNGVLAPRPQDKKRLMRYLDQVKRDRERGN